MSALTDLKKLVMEGLLEKEVDIAIKDKTFKITLSTVTLIEDLKVMSDAGLTAAPQNDIESLNYIMALLPYAIKKINGEAVVPEQVRDIVGLMDGTSIGDIYGAYVALHTKELQAGAELKNS